MVSILDYLVQYCDEITPREFYREIFPEGELDIKDGFTKGKYVGVAVSVGDSIKRHTITDDLNKVDELCMTDEFCIMSPVSYAGKSRKSECARFLHALAIDVDGIRADEYKGAPEGMSTLFYQFDGNGPSNYLPKPTMLVMSGTGIHLYYVFEKPIPLFPNIVKQLEVYKRRLTWQLWTQGVTDLQDRVQYESLFQGFRMPGTVTKKGDRARAFLVSGRKVTMEYMNSFVPEEFRTTDFAYKSALTLKQAKEKYPEWYEKRIENNEPKGRWVCKRDLYEWWKSKIYASAEDGHRYWCVMALATYAKKCNIPLEELEKDAMQMIDMLHERGNREDNPFTADDVMAALEAYNDSYITYPIDTISRRTGIRIEKNKRNGRKQAVHVKYMNNQRAFKVELGECTNGGRPTKEALVREYMEVYPEDSVSRAAAQLGMSRTTVYKYARIIAEEKEKAAKAALDAEMEQKAEFERNTQPQRPNETPEQRSMRHYREWQEEIRK